MIEFSAKNWSSSGMNLIISENWPLPTWQTIPQRINHIRSIAVLPLAALTYIREPALALDNSPTEVCNFPSVREYQYSNQSAEKHLEIF